MRYRGSLWFFAIAAVLAGGCGGGRGSLAFGPSGNGPPPANSQQASYTDLGSQCQSACERVAQCEVSVTVGGDAGIQINPTTQDPTSLADCVASCQRLVAVTACQSQTAALIRCIVQTPGDCTGIINGCASQVKDVGSCANLSSTNACVPGQCDGCSGACASCTCQHPNDATACANVCPAAG